MLTGYHAINYLIDGTTSVGVSDITTIRGTSGLKLQNNNGTTITISPDWKVNTYMVLYNKGLTDK